MMTVLMHITVAEVQILHNEEEEEEYACPQDVIKHVMDQFF